MPKQPRPRPVPAAAAARLIQGKPALVREVWDRLQPELQARAFTISGVECAATIGRARDLAARLPAGGDWEKLKAGILSEISPWLGTEAAARRRAEMLLRLHGWQAYAQVQYDLMEAHKDAFPYRQYLSSGDGRVRASHAALDGKVLPADHPFWAAHTPPWEFGCRCDCAPITAAEAGRMRDADQALPPEQRRVADAPAMRLIERGDLVDPHSGGRLDIRTPRERAGTGYEWRPGDRRKSVESILDGLGEAGRVVFDEWAANQFLVPGASTLADWLKVSDGAAPATAGQMLACPRGTVPADLAARLLGAEPGHPAARAMKAWGDDEEEFKALIDPANTAPEAVAWREVVERTLSVIEPVKGKPTLFRGWQFDDDAGMENVMRDLDEGRPWRQPRSGMSMSFSQDTAMREKFIGGADKIAVMWILEKARSPVDVTGIFRALGTRYQDEAEAIMPRSKAVRLLGKSQITIKDSSGNDRIVVVYDVRE